MKAEIETNNHTRVIEQTTEAELLREIEALPSMLEDRSASIVLSSLQSPDAVLGIRRLDKDRWFVNAVSFQPELLPGADEIKIAQVRELVHLFLTNGSWLSLLRIH
jgi:hypothetical protein